MAAPCALFGCVYLHAGVCLVHLLCGGSQPSCTPIISFVQKRHLLHYSARFHRLFTGSENSSGCCGVICSADFC
jgi:hypothetical protein